MNSRRGSPKQPDLVIFRLANDTPIENKPAPKPSPELPEGTVELPWDPDPRAILECKRISVDVSGGGTLDSSLSRAYMELNDIHLKEKDVGFFLGVNRLCSRESALRVNLGFEPRKYDLQSGTPTLNSVQLASPHPISRELAPASRSSLRK